MMTDDIFNVEDKIRIQSIFSFEMLNFNVANMIIGAVLFIIFNAIFDIISYNILTNNIFKK